MTTYIVDIEAVDTRYTKQWKEYLPRQLQRATNEEVVVISGGETPQATTPWAFLNFGGTNVYKSKQLEQIGEMFCEGKVKDGDYFLYTDAWNPTVIQLRYMAELLGVNISIGGLWHAGSYDPQDFLGRLIGNKPWVRNAERSMTCPPLDALDALHETAPRPWMQQCAIQRQVPPGTRCFATRTARCSRRGPRSWT